MRREGEGRLCGKKRKKDYFHDKLIHQHYVTYHCMFNTTQLPRDVGNPQACAVKKRSHGCHVTTGTYKRNHLLKWQNDSAYISMTVKFISAGKKLAMLVNPKPDNNHPA